MRIVHLTRSTTAEITGGLEYHIAYLADALRQSGHEVIVVNTQSLTANSRNPVAHARVPAPAETRRGANLLPGYVVHEMDALRETLAMFMHRILKRPSAASIVEQIDHLKPDVVHQHSYLGELGMCRLISQKYPVVFTNHTGAYLHLDRFAYTRWIQRQLMKQFAAVIGPSQELLPKTDNSHYIPNGVDTAKFYPFTGEEIRRCEIKYRCEGKQVFFCPRRWAPTKGIIYLARSLRLLSQATRARSVFLFAGNQTPGYDQYQQNVQNILDTVEGDVRVLGNIGHTELAELMNISRVGIIPSLMEATSLACLEAMACGTPVIGTQTTGLTELIRHEENGWLIPPKDERALAVQIEEISAMSPGDLRPMGDAAAETVRERYTWKVAAQKTEEVYKLAIQKWRRDLDRKRKNRTERQASFNWLKAISLKDLRRERSSKPRRPRGIPAALLRNPPAK